MNIPGELKYTKNHEWVRVEGNSATVGITDYAQKELGDIVFVEPQDPGTEVQVETEMTTIESVKAASDIYAPVSGSVTESNTALEDRPELVNTDPYGDGWVIKIELSDPSQVDSLMSGADYQSMIEGGGEE